MQDVTPQHQREDLRLKILNSFAIELIGIPERHQLAWYVAHEVVGRLGFDDCVVYFADSDETMLRQVAAVGDKNPHGFEILNPLEIPFGRGITGEVAETGKALIANDLENDNRYIQDLNLARAEICVPIISDDQVIGVIDSESQQPNYFTSEHLEILTTVAAMAGAKLKSVQHAEDLKKSEERFRDFSVLASDWFWELGPDLEFTYLSSTFQEHTGIDPNEVIRQTRKQRYSDAMAQLSPEEIEIWETHNTTLEQHLPFSDVILKRPYADGSFRYVRMSGKPVFDAGGNFTGYRGTSSNVTTAKAAEVALEESESRYRKLLDEQSDLISIFSLEGHRTYVNDAFCEFLGRSREELLAKQAGSLMNQKDAEEIMLSVHNLTPENPTSEHEYEVLRHDGERRWIIWTDKGKFDSEGNLESIQAVGRDITDRKRSEEQFRHYFNLPLIGSAVYSPDKTWQLINDAFCDLIGYSREEMMERTWVDFTHPDDLEENLRLFDASVSSSGDAAYTMDKRFIHKNGSVIYADICVQCIRNPDGSPNYLLLHVIDTTPRKEAEKELRESEARLASILYLAPEGVITTDEKGMIKVFSQGAERIFGYIADEVIGQSMDLLIPERFRQKHHEHMINFGESALEFKEMTERDEISGLRKDGTEFPAEASVSKLVFSSEKFFTIILHDITEQKKSQEYLLSAKEEAEIANRAKTEFLANMSHELRTPLNSILGFSEMIQREIIGPIGDPRYGDYATSINVSGSHLLEVITDILDISKIEANEAQLDESRIDIRKAINDCLKIVRERANSVEVTLTVDIPEDTPLLFADERRIKQIMLNLLSNAVKFTPPKGNVTVQAKLDSENRIRICVSDTGVGIPAKDLPTIAEPFTQAHNQAMTRGHQQGTGLGLSLVKSLTTLHRGKVSIESAVDEGTTVTIEFPPERTIA